jgi:hypothetical protein
MAIGDGVRKSPELLAAQFAQVVAAVSAGLSTYWLPT